MNHQGIIHIDEERNLLCWGELRKVHTLQFSRQTYIPLKLSTASYTLIVNSLGREIAAMRVKGNSSNEREGKIST